MGISSEEAQRIQFSGSEHSYDGAEVERFRRQVVDALSEYEETVSAEAPSSAGTAGQEVAAAQRIRNQAVGLAERMLRDVMGTTGDSASGLETWQEAAMLRTIAQEELEFATEEARRVAAIAAAERAVMHSKYEIERAEVRAELQRELQDSRAAAADEATTIVSDAKSEAKAILVAALQSSEETKREVADDVHRLERRLVVLQTALADAEIRFRRLAATAANEIGTLTAIADQDTAPLKEAESELHLAAVDLTSAGLAHDRTGSSDPTTRDPVEDPASTVMRDPDVSFYQRRLAGLRDRLEKSGHPPE